ncbi:hypothetical protein A2961_01015 [Candidatus Woesebacteria bacterium RIFCSPLOWO2_01_FULL_39_21]|uniref:Membrane protein 6-pyruvoyl-tetrahydropterin synthase-related domain-containing protein n=1 Tax=Candidatus Woesebacteria bacterium RIFCSPLOWO2_01_FULL_39_21 TaxID=1802519 RepID=A0A1F8BE16_9BACT|nr:MAG: hypothetical protein A2961_01015 [Candidatus Woesebacteria bacterium RIFCSPLOWO2_01_FULL_39_21]
MKLFKRFVSSRNFWPLVAVLFFGILASRHLFTPGYFNMHDDLQVMRTLEMEKCFKDFQVPCRWVPDMGYGFGFPLFNFYPPLPYLYGMLFRLIGFSFVGTVKLVFASTFIFSGVTMYFLASKFFKRFGGVLSAIFYIWAPYHAVDVYVRGAMNEAWALVFFPAIFYFSYKLITDHRPLNTDIVLLSLSWAGLFLSHNLMVMIFTPFFALWCLLWIVKRYKNNSIKFCLEAFKSLVLSGVIAFGLAAFFTLPALLENKYTQIEGQLVGYYDYTAHFVSLRQLLISRFWGYGPSVWVDAEDRMSFQIGHLHWIISIIIGLFLIKRIIKALKSKNYLLISDHWFLTVILLLLFGWFAAFMTHLKSIFIYQAIPQLKYIQFSWRFLTIVIFAFSLAIGVLPILLRRKIGNWFVSLLVIGLLILNWSYFKPEYGKNGPLTDKEKFSGAAWELQQTAGIYDYLTKDAKTAPKSPKKMDGEIIEGKGLVYTENHPERTNWLSFFADIRSESAKLRINVMNFPDWKVLVDGKEVKEYVDKSEEWGRIYIDVSQGEHFIYARLENTPIRSIANGISLIFWIGLLSYPLVKKFRRPSG